MLIEAKHFLAEGHRSHQGKKNKKTNVLFLVFLSLNLCQPNSTDQRTFVDSVQLQLMFLCNGVQIAVDL